MVAFYHRLHTGLLLWIELKRHEFQPILPYDKALEATFPYWRASSALVTVALIVVTFRNFYKVVTSTRQDLKTPTIGFKDFVEVEAANEAKSRFLAQLSHELRTPLNGILGTSEAMMEGIYGPLTKAQEKALGTVDRAANHQLLLVNDLLDMAKVEQESSEPTMEAVSLTIIAHDVLEMPDKATQSSVTLEVQEYSEPIYLVTDNRRVRQMLLNLVGNAIGFTPEGGTVTLRIAAAEAWISLAVQDTGIGIAPGRARMFEAFTQVDSTQQRKHAGTGLGLNSQPRSPRSWEANSRPKVRPIKGAHSQSSFLTEHLPTPRSRPLREEEAVARAKKPEAPVVQVKPPEKESPAQVPPSAEQVPAEPVDPDSLHVLLVDDTPANIGHLRDFLLSADIEYPPLPTVWRPSNKPKRATWISCLWMSRCRI